MHDNPKPGDWALFRASGFGWREDYGVAQIERVTPKTVYAEAIYRKQFPIESVLVMPSEEAARKLLERITSAQAEAQRRINAAQDYARRTIDQELLSARKEQPND